MLYAINNGQSYEDNHTYFVNVPTALDGQHPLIEQLLVSAARNPWTDNNPSCLFRATLLESSPNGVRSFHEYLTPSMFFVRVEPGEESNLYPKYTMKSHEGVDSVYQPAKDLFASLTHEAANVLLTEWKHGNQREETFLPAFLNMLEKKYGNPNFKGASQGYPLLSPNFVREKFGLPLHVLRDRQRRGYRGS